MDQYNKSHNGPIGKVNMSGIFLGLQTIKLLSLHYLTGQEISTTSVCLGAYSNVGESSVTSFVCDTQNTTMEDLVSGVPAAKPMVTLLCRVS